MPGIHRSEAHHRGLPRCGCGGRRKGLHDLCQSVGARGAGNVHAPRGMAPHETALRMRATRLALAVLPMVSLPVFAVDIDGRIDPDEWQGAHHVTDFRKVQPLSGAPASLQTQVWILATPEGLAVAFRNAQPPSVPRTGQRVQRDFEEQVDRVNLMVDFDGDGRTGYNFTISSTDGVYDAVVTNETQFNKDWDGNWKHATSNDAEGWSAEILIPWYIAPMREGSNGERRIRVYVDRVVGSTGERVAWPAVSFKQSRFLSGF